MLWLSWSSENSHIFFCKPSGEIGFPTVFPNTKQTCMSLWGNATFHTIHEPTYLSPWWLVWPIPTIHMRTKALLIKHVVEKNGKCTHRASKWVTMQQHKIVIRLILLRVSFERNEPEITRGLHTPGLGIFVSWYIDSTPNTALLWPKCWPPKVWKSGPDSWWGWIHSRSRFASSSPQLRVIHGHVQLKCALIIEGTIREKDVLIFTEHGRDHSHCFRLVRMDTLIWSKCLG